MTDEQAEIRMWAVTRPISEREARKPNGRREIVNLTVARLRRDAILSWLAVWVRGERTSWRYWKRHGYRAERVTVRVEG